MSEEKECFFISPIGDDGSDSRNRSDKLMEYVIKEALSDYGYSVIRADQMDEPGSITSQVIEKTVESDLVIADLTGHNPNVFYELALRHATGEPFIQLIESSESIPFDISDLRTIHYGLDVAEADEAKEQIRSQLDSLEDGDPEFDNPISRSAEIQSLRESKDPTDQNLAEILQTITRLDKKVDRLESSVVQSPRQRNIRVFEDDAIRFEINGTDYKVHRPKLTRDVVLDIAAEEEIAAKTVESQLKEQGIEVEYN